MSQTLERILKGRHALLAENEEPRDVLINVELRNALRREMDPMMLYRVDAIAEHLMGMKIEWTVPRPYPRDISIRTANGDMRICL